MKIMILGSFRDKQTANYILDSCKEHVYDAIGIDIRGIFETSKNNYEAQKRIIKEIETASFKPDLIIVLKGLEMTMDTLHTIKTMHPEAKIVNWFFDAYLGEVPIWENKEHSYAINFFDYFFCSLKGVADKLIESGYKNAYWLPEAYCPRNHKPVHMNNFQSKKYGSDVSFCGNLGYLKQHPNRIKTLERLEKEGFHFKIWGNVACYNLKEKNPVDETTMWKGISPILKHFHQKTEAINEHHSMVCQASCINLGIDQNPELELSQSARLYRVLYAGGLYLTNATKGLEKMFKINPPGKMPTGEEDLIVYYDLDNMIELADFLLEFDDIRKQIAKNGKQVIEKHSFSSRIKNIIDLVFKKQTEVK